MNNKQQPAFELFVYENMERFIEGYPKSNAFTNFNSWALRNGYSKCTDINYFDENMKIFCDIIERNVLLNKYVYKLHEAGKQYFNIDDYQLILF